MLTVNHLERSRSHRVLWMLEELGVPYEMTIYRRDPKTLLAPPELAAVHPLGKSPVVTDDGVTIAESGAILEYLNERHGGGRFVPTQGTDAHRQYRYFMHYAEGSLMSPMMVAVVCMRLERAPMPFFVRPISRKLAGGIRTQFVEPNLRRHLKFLEQTLANSTWFAGDTFSAADIQMSYPLEALCDRAQHLGVGEHILGFIQRIRQRPAYQRAIEKGGPVLLDLH